MSLLYELDPSIATRPARDQLRFDHMKWHGVNAFNENPGGIVRVVVGVIGIGLLLAGCSTPVDGEAKQAPATTETSAQPSTPAAATSSELPPAAAPPTVATVELARQALLKRSELANILGDTNMRQVSTYDKPWDPATGIDPPDCAAKLLFQESIASYGYLAAIGDHNQGEGGHTASQMIQVFPVTSKDWPVPNRQALRAASTIVQHIYDEQCREGTTFTTTAKDVTQHWTAGPIVSENPSALDDQRQDTSRGGGGAVRQEGPPRSCYHAAMARANAVIESIVCGNGDSLAQANLIIDQIAAKLPG
ncbi:sensor domain-containing protein [Mycolicibacterium senegalense]|uniref:sensor domain-containing protein n=1 Tax=Mycolicibacterium senegalense TaxID=1796 RepID=UPI003AAA236A